MSKSATKEGTTRYAQKFAGRAAEGRATPESGATEDFFAPASAHDRSSAAAGSAPKSDRNTAVAVAD